MLHQCTALCKAIIDCPRANQFSGLPASASPVLRHVSPGMPDVGLTWAVLGARAGAAGRQMQGPGGAVRCVELAEDWLAAGGDAGLVRTWDFSRALQTAAQVYASQTPLGAPYSCLCFHKGMQLAWPGLCDAAVACTPRLVPHAQGSLVLVAALCALECCVFLVPMRMLCYGFKVLGQGLPCLA